MSDQTMTEEELIRELTGLDPFSLPMLVREIERKRDLVAKAAIKGPEKVLESILTKRESKMRRGPTSSLTWDANGFGDYLSMEEGRDKCRSNKMGLKRANGSVDLVRLGDDCSVTKMGDGSYLVTSIDTLVEGRHFLADEPPEVIARKLTRANLSDVACMGARPERAWISLSCPDIDKAWIKAFYEELIHTLDVSGVALMGGNTTRGELQLCLAIQGCAPVLPLLRTGAVPGDDVWVTGVIGLSALARLRPETNAGLSGMMAWMDRREEPLLDFARSLLFLAHSAIDISDGFLRSVGHLMEASDTRAILGPHLPLFTGAGPYEDPELFDISVNGGDDYQILFTSPPKARGRLLEAGMRSGVVINHVGSVLPGKRMPRGGVEERPEDEREGPGPSDGEACSSDAPSWRSRISIVDALCREVDLPMSGYDHFA